MEKEKGIDTDFCMRFMLSLQVCFGEDKSQSELAELLNVSQTAVSEVKTNRREPSKEMIVGFFNKCDYIDSLWVITGKNLFENQLNWLIKGVRQMLYTTEHLSTETRLPQKLFDEAINKKIVPASHIFELILKVPRLGGAIPKSKTVGLVSSYTTYDIEHNNIISQPGVAEIIKFFQKKLNDYQAIINEQDIQIAQLLAEIADIKSQIKEVD